MANMLQKLALKLAEKLLAFAQQKAFGRDDAFIYSRARVIVELDRIQAEAAKKQEEFQAKMDLLEKEWKRQIRIVSWSTMSPAEANKDRALMYQEDGIVESPPDSAAILQFPGKTTQQGG
ncbi:hypothetical protein H6769_03430 [Candidatus Peribacteria bacterium]|nr:hypothetical protein [Candidatus Peribacteria bacterium]